MNPELRRFKKRYEELSRDYIYGGKREAAGKSNQLLSGATDQGVEIGDVLLASILGLVRELLPAAVQGRAGDALRAAEFFINSMPLSAGESPKVEDAVGFSDWLERILGDCSEHAEQRGLLFAKLQKACAEAERAEKRLKFLNHAGTILSGSLDYPATLSKVAKLSIEEIADCCIIDIVEKNGEPPVTVAIKHRDPAMLKILQEMRRRYPNEPSEPFGSCTVLRTGKAELYQEVSDQVMKEYARDSEHLRLIQMLELKWS